MRALALLILLIAAALIVVLPLVGLVIAGHSIASYLYFPPRTVYVSHTAFEWKAFVVLCLPVLGAAVFIWSAAARARLVPVWCASRQFPWWGWLGLTLIAAGWSLAWIDGLAPNEWRRQTFALLWLGYILTMNGLVHRLGSRAPIVRQWGLFVALFVASAVFWWLFEYLNQFVRNWHYTGIYARDDADYVLQATLPFSTVLPAVLSTWAWLAHFQRLEPVAGRAIRGECILAWPALFAGILGLAGIGIWPEALFPLLWLAPLLLLVGLQQLLLGETIFSPVARGDWRPVIQPALAALVCGFFWELWNYGSLAKWQYSIPYVQRFHLFEMPLLGYAGYLAFGLECAVVADLVARVMGQNVLALMLETPPPRAHEI